MAKLSADKKSITVVKGDTLYSIAEDYAAYSDDATYQQLAAINGIADPAKIVVGQIINLVVNPSAVKPISYNIVINQFGLLSTDDTKLFAAWTWARLNTKGYKISWTYSTGDGIWFDGTTQEINIDKDVPELSRQSVYTIPTGAKQVRFRVKPISETKTEGDKDTTYWTANWSETKTWTNETPLSIPPSPNVEIDKYRLTATVDNVDIDGAAYVQFEIVKNNTTVIAKPYVKIVTGHASYSRDVDAGGEYKVRCRASKTNSSSSVTSEWSDYSSNTTTIPATPSAISTIRANSETSVYLEWPETNTATSYDIQYATKLEYLDGSNQATTESDIEYTHYLLTGLESGTEYFFRIRAKNSKGTSGWSEVVSIIIGKAPAAPTTWSSTTTAVMGETINLYWVHNTEDGSSQTFAELDLYINGVQEILPPMKNTEDEDERDKTRSVSIVNNVLHYYDQTGEEQERTLSLEDGATIQWRVRTAGVTHAYGDWSIQRTIDIYAPPTLALRVMDSNSQNVDVITAFPFYVYAVAGPEKQAPTGYHLTITSNEFYETTDNLGNPKTINAGEQVYSKHFDISQPLMVVFSANNVNLENNVSYTVTCTVSLNSGLSTETSLDFSVSWSDVEYVPNAEINVDSDSLTTTIRPYCDITSLEYHKVVLVDGSYLVTEETINGVFGELVPNVKTTTGESVYMGTTDTGEEDVYYCTVEQNTRVDDVLLSVYRREFDGGYTELAVNLDSASNIAVTDPHPSLDMARYRIVATSKTTGAVSYYDLPGYPINGTAVVIQWNEDWSNFETSNEDATVQPPWSGSLLKLPYNIDVSTDVQPDVAFVEYIGRSNPVSYYGTQVGETSSWKCEIPKKDVETLYALRRLSKWMGDVYVREPSGLGYWANITVQISQTHGSVKTPVTLNIKRVEGGA